MILCKTLAFACGIWLWLPLGWLADWEVLTTSVIPTYLSYHTYIHFTFKKKRQEGHNPGFASCRQLYIYILEFYNSFPEHQFHRKIPVPFYSHAMHLVQLLARFRRDNPSSGC
ncbi:hypothetical protein F4678DRAFT_99536 [Xylaria arbuscula]|nr:hypothetical protein F4678DRAFT_99536 [Xylaria arbuscula]